MNQFPDLSKATIIGLDTETCDPNLMDLGPGDIRGDGHLVGVSLAVPEGDSWYFPLGHETGENLDIEAVSRYLNETLGRGIPITGANTGAYDYGWLRTIGVEISGPNYDTQLLEPLIDEEQSHYNLETLGVKYTGAGKNEEALIARLAELGHTGKSAKGFIYKLTPEEVAVYAKEDAVLPIRIYEQQIKEIERQDLWDIVNLESKMVKVLDQMRNRGIRVDLSHAEEMNEYYHIAEDKLESEVHEFAGFPCSPWSADDLSIAFDKLGIPYPQTDKGNPSFEGEYLDRIGDEYPFAKLVREYRKMNKMRRDFIEGGVLKWHINGRVHAQIHGLRRDDYGTRSGRLSYSNPNLQQVPSRDPVWGPRIRSLYLPEEGEQWVRLDYSQQEPRIGVHYAYKRGFPKAAEARQKYIDDPKTDYHQMVADFVTEAGYPIERRPAKDLNLGMAYGMGVKKLASSLGLTYEEAKPLFSYYHRALPFVKGISDEVSRTAVDRGWIRTLLGRRRHYEKWQPTSWTLRAEHGYRAYSLEDAKELWPFEPLVRAFTHKAYNALVQGTAADMTKQAMVDLLDAGIVPLVQVHDELNFSVGNNPDLSQDSVLEIKFIKRIMEHAVELEVPIVADVETGPNWGSLVKSDE